MKVVTHTEAGGGKANQDYLVAERHPLAADTWICAIADGQGGRPEGDKASSIACRSVAEICRRTPSDHLAQPGAWMDILADANARVASGTEGFTTLIGFAVGPDFICGASVGDSKLYFQPRGGEIIELTANQDKNPPCGVIGAYFAAFSTQLPEEGSVLLAVTDGVWKYAGYEAIQNVLKLETSTAAAEILLTAIRARGGQQLPDDVAIIGAWLP